MNQKTAVKMVDTISYVVYGRYTLTIPVPLYNV